MSDLVHIDNKQASAPRSQASAETASATFEENVAFIANELGRMQARADRLVKALERIAQGGNEVFRDLPSHPVITRDEMSNIARDALYSIENL